VLVVALAGLLGAAPQSPTLTIADVNVVDVIGGQVLSNRDVTIAGERIVEVAASGRSAGLPGGRVVDGTDKFLIPGLWDMHAHRFESWLALDVANGVTGIRDMGNDLDEILRLRTVTASGALIGPRIVAAGPILDDAPGDWPLRQRVRNAEEGRAAVRMLKARGVDLIKVHNFTPREAFFAIAEEARRQGLPVAGHVPLKVTVDEAIEAGISSIEHFSEDGRVWKTCTAGQAYTLAPCLPYFRMLAAKGVWQTPTLFAITEVGRVDASASLVGAEALVYVPPVVRQMWEAERAAMAPSARAALRASASVAPAVTRDMTKAGVGILAGCDGGVAGFCLHTELDLMVRGGLTTAEALRTATINPARYLRRDGAMGSVAAGKVADLVLLDGNPLENVSNLHRVTAVVLNGRLLERSALDGLLAAARAAARQ
jgi:imidazolonepropionase-like amidohydrolase